MASLSFGRVATVDPPGNTRNAGMTSKESLADAESAASSLPSQPVRGRTMCFV
jgi:hypothetical protein